MKEIILDFLSKPISFNTNKMFNIICENNINDIKTPIDEIFNHKDFVIILTFLLIGLNHQKLAVTPKVTRIGEGVCCLSMAIVFALPALYPISGLMPLYLEMQNKS